MRTLRLPCIFATLVWTSAHSGPLEPMVFTGQVQQAMKEGRVNACGIRTVGVPDFPESSPPPATIFIVDVSANVSLPGFAVVKGGVKAIRASDMQAYENTGKPAPKTLTIERIWVRGKGGEATRQPPNTQSIASETPGALLYVSEVEPAMIFIGSAVADETVQVGFKVVGDDVERIFYGRVETTKSDREQFAACMDDFLKAAGTSSPRK